jgi:taurine dioxygenase
LPDELPSIINKFGNLYIHNGEKKYNSSPVIGLVHADGTRKWAEGTVNHADRTYHRMPPRLGMLMMDIVPVNGGGTIFVNVIEAYNDLEPDIKKLIDKKLAVHNPHFGGLIGTLHPVIKIKPETGEKFIYVNRGFTKSIGNEDPQVLKTILNHIDLDKYKCQVNWSKGDVTLWDNYGCQHRAVYDYYPETRTGYRVLTENMFK